MAFSYGRLPPTNAPALSLGRFLTGTIPAHPAAEDYLHQLSGWQMLGNDRAGDCVAVTWANTRRLVTHYLSTENYPSQAQVWQFYKTQNPNFDPNGTAQTNGPGSPADKGMVIQTALDHLHTNGGPDGVKAWAFAKVDPTNLAEVEAALAIFGSLWTGLVVLKANQTEFSAHQPWTDVPTSAIDGRHSVISGGYAPEAGTDFQIDFITWGAETQFEASFWNGAFAGQKLIEEAWVVIWPEHLQTKEFQQGINLAQLRADYQALTGQPLPPPPPPPQVPVITSATTASGRASNPFRYRIKATNNPASFGATGLPAGLSLDTSTGIISGTPAAAGTFSVQLSATNAAGTGTAVLTLTVKVGPQPPAITSPTTASGKASNPFRYRIKATNNPASFGATGLPAGLSLDTSTGIISGTPAAAGTFSVQLSATNAAGTGTAVLTLTVKVGPQPPAITSATTASGRAGKPFSYRIKATNNPASFGATGLPPGLSVDSSTGVISGTPAGAGTFSVQLSATNAAGTGTGALALTVSIPVSGEPPAFMAPSAQAGFQAAWVPPPASPASPPVPSAPPPVGAQPTLADLGRQLQEMSRQLAALQAAKVPPPASPAPPPVPPAGAQPTPADLGRQLQEMGSQLIGGAGGSRKTGIVAASGIVMQGLLTIQAMTEETGNPNAGGASRS